PRPDRAHPGGDRRPGGGHPPVADAGGEPGRPPGLDGAPRGPGLDLYGRAGRPRPCRDRADLTAQGGAGRADRVAAPSRRTCPRAHWWPEALETLTHPW